MKRTAVWLLAAVAVCILSGCGSKKELAKEDMVSSHIMPGVSMEDAPG